jgi:hypothetical protein
MFDGDRPRTHLVRGNDRDPEVFVERWTISGSWAAGWKRTSPPEDVRSNRRTEFAPVSQARIRVHGRWRTKGWNKERD